MLTDLEFRVWEQYQHSADDFGVMRMTALQIQSDNKALAKRPRSVIERALAEMVTVKLVEQFTHQQQDFLCQLDWQNFQKKSYTKHTQLPKPPAELLARMTPLTQELMATHPGGGKVRDKKKPFIPEPFQESSRNVPETVQDNSKTISATRETLTLTPTLTPTRTLTENEPLDEAWFRFLSLYPQSRVERGRIVEDGFIAACREVGTVAVFAKLDAHKRSAQWRKGYIPKMSNYFGPEKLWKQALPEQDTPQGQSRHAKFSGLNAGAEIADV